VNELVELEESRFISKPNANPELSLQLQSCPSKLKKTLRLARVKLPQICIDLCRRKSLLNCPRYQKAGSAKPRILILAASFAIAWTHRPLVTRQRAQSHSVCWDSQALRSFSDGYFGQEIRVRFGPTARWGRRDDTFFCKENAKNRPEACPCFLL
jgi:hypothetical protein